MLKIKMLQDDLGSENGFIVLEFKKDREYEVGLPLYNAFVKERKTAIDVPDAPVENGEKVLNTVITNKAITPEANKKGFKKGKK